MVAGCFWLGGGNVVWATVGAVTPFTCYEGEHGRLGGGAALRYLTNAPTTEFSSAELEASGHAFVELNAPGEFVEWTNTTGQAVTFVNLRFCIPDAPAGGGLDATLDLYVDGIFRQALNLTSRQTWLYEGPGSYGGNEQNPATGNPRVFFDDRHTFIVGAPVAPGSTIQLRQGSTNNAAFYYIDVIDLETPPAPLNQPANSLSILSYGAVANNPNFDSTTAIQSCFNAAQSQGKSVWIPPGTFYLKTKSGLNATGIAIEGAGMWYSTIYRDVPLPNDSPLGAVFTMTSCTVRNFAVDANAPSRAVVDGCGGSMDITGNYWLAEGIWTQHTMSGFWASGVGGMVRNCRLISIWADGCNLNNVAASGSVGNFLTASNNFVRGTGDDAMAINSVNYNEINGVYTYYLPMQNTTFINNTTIGAWGGKGLAIYGGRGHLVKDNYTSDTARYIGLGVGKFGVNGSDLLSATVVGNVIVRSGGNGFQQQQQAMMIGNDGDGQGVGSVVNAYCASNTIVDSVFAAVGLSTSSNIVFQHNTIINPGREGIVVGMYALRPGLGNAIVYSNSFTGLNPGFATISNNSSTYALIQPLAAVNFSSSSGAVVEACGEGGQALGQLESGDGAVYSNVDLGGKDLFVARVASGGLGGVMEIRLDHAFGPVIGVGVVPPTGGWQSYVNVYAAITNTSGVRNVCLGFSGGDGRLFNVQHFGFFSEPPILSQQLVVGNTYALKSVSNGKYVGVSPAAGGVLLVNQNAITAAGQFEILDAGGGRVGFRSVGSNTLVCAENTGAAALVANRTGLGAWETFSQFQTDLGQLSLRAEINGKFIGFLGATNALIANATAFNAGQHFTAEFVAGVAPATPGGLRAVPGDSRVALTWAGAVGATGYFLKRSSMDGGPYVLITTNLALSYVDATVTKCAHLLLCRLGIQSCRREYELGSGYGGTWCIGPAQLGGDGVLLWAG
ncbi:MAG: carbohydrate-binding protein [Verrucomicrobiota bacterium]